MTKEIDTYVKIVMLNKKNSCSYVESFYKVIIIRSVVS